MTLSPPRNSPGRLPGGGGLGTVEEEGGTGGRWKLCREAPEDHGVFFHEQETGTVELGPQSELVNPQFRQWGLKHS